LLDRVPLKPFVPSVGDCFVFLTSVVRGRILRYSVPVLTTAWTIEAMTTASVHWKAQWISQTHGHGGPHKHGKTFSIAQANNTKNSDAKTKPHPLLPSQSIIQVKRMESPWMAEAKSNGIVTFADARNGFILSVRDSFVFLNYASLNGEFSHIKNRVFDNGLLQWVIYDDNHAILTVETAHARRPGSGFNISASGVGLGRFGDVSAGVGRQAVLSAVRSSSRYWRWGRPIHWGSLRSVLAAHQNERKRAACTPAKHYALRSLKPPTTKQTRSKYETWRI
jgi:hypothetical protein